MSKIVVKYRGRDYIRGSCGGRTILLTRSEFSNAVDRYTDYRWSEQRRKSEITKKVKTKGSKKSGRKK